VIARDVTQSHLKVTLFGNIQTVLRHLTGHLLYSKATPLVWYVVFEYLKWKLQGAEITLETVCLYGVLTSAHNRRDAVVGWTESLRPNYIHLRKLPINPYLFSLFELQKQKSAEDLVLQVLGIPKRLESLTSLMNVTSVVKTQKDTPRRDPEREPVLFEPTFVGRSADPTGRSPKDKPHKGNAKDLRNDSFPSDYFLIVASYWDKIIHFRPHHSDITESQRLKRKSLLAQNPSEERRGRSRNIFLERSSYENFQVECKYHPSI
jgi:hypothetical protein